MRSLKFAILGLLNRRPMTGYELAKEFSYELAQFWYANHSQIYPELKKLHTEGLVEYDVEISGDVLESKRYFITDQGKSDFINWLHKDEKIPKTSKDIFRMRMYFSNNMALDARIERLESQQAQHVERLNTLLKTMEQYPEVPRRDSDRFGDFIVLRGAIMRQENVISWLEECIGYCKNPEQTKPIASKPGNGG